MVKYLALLLAGILAASCIFDADQCVMPADKPHSVMFTVALDQQRTKAAWSEEYPSEAGVPFDFRILPDELRVVVFAQDGSRIGVLQDLGYWPINEEQTEFQFMGQMPDAFVEHFNANGATEPHYKFMVLANCSDNQSNVENTSYNSSQLDPSQEHSAIPMWGVKTVDLTSLLTTDTQDLDVIWLLRAAAKIEVKLSENEKKKGTKINSATLKYYNQNGYLLPEGAMNVSDTRSLDQESCVKVYRHTIVGLPFYKDEESGDYHVYVTEYDNQNYPGERNMISLEFNIKGENKYFEDAISFCKYSNGTPVDGSDYDIVRNHIYEFEVLSIAGSSLTLNYKVADWDAEDWGDGLDYEEHDIAYPTYHNPVVPKRYLESTPEQVSKFEITELPQMSYHANALEAGAFECYFQIVAPVRNELWKPVFMGGTKENYRIRVYNHKNVLLFETGTKENAMGVCADNNEWFRIVVFPLSADGAGKDEIEFGITYHQMWTDQWINLYVNGEYDHIRWPQSGDNPKVIKIKHIVAGAE